MLRKNTRKKTLCCLVLLVKQRVRPTFLVHVRAADVRENITRPL